MKTLKHQTLTAWSALALMVITSGCGGEAYRPAGTAQNNGQNNGGFTDNTGTGGTPWVPGDSDPDWGSGGDTGSSDGTTDPVVVVPAPSYDFAVTGKGGTADTFTAPIVDTDNLLQVRISAASAGQLSLSSGSYSNFSANYGCVEYKVEALGQSKSTGVLSVSGNSALCPGAPTYRDLDFSSSLASGHNSVNVKITEVRYDFYCLWAKDQNAGFAYYYPYGSYYGYSQQNESLFCPTKTVFKNHTVNGRMQIRVNGTQFSSY